MRRTKRFVNQLVDLSFPFTLFVALGVICFAPSTEAALLKDASTAKTPEVVKIDPASVTPGSQVVVKVTGKNFASQARVSFSNPGILVLATTVRKSTEIEVKIRVAADAPIGNTGLFVVNPDDNEVEAAFKVEEANTSSVASGSSSKAKGSAANAPAQQFEVINLGDGLSILQNPGKPSGILKLAKGKLEYREGGKVVFAAKASDVKEIAPNVFLGINTGTFHILLNSGKSYNFMAASLRPADSESIVQALVHALH